MKNLSKKRMLIISFIIIIALALFFAVFTIFFDQAVLVRKGTFYRANTKDKVVALTFDDGPSDLWTPRILDELKRAGIKATFFMVGEHVQKYPEVARRVIAEGHDVGVHTFTHHVLFFSQPDTLEKEITDTQKIIREVTGRNTKLFRPPKAWLTESEKKRIKDMGYEIVLWTLNSKDWVTFDDKYMRNYIVKNIRPGDIILFHDSGGFFSIEGGSRKETLRVIFRLGEKLREKGYRFVTVTELLAAEGKNGPTP